MVTCLITKDPRIIRFVQHWYKSGWYAVRSPAEGIDASSPSSSRTVWERHRSMQVHTHTHSNLHNSNASQWTVALGARVGDRNISSWSATTQSQQINWQFGRLKSLQTARLQTVTLVRLANGQTAPHYTWISTYTHVKRSYSLNTLLSRVREWEWCDAMSHLF